MHVQVMQGYVQPDESLDPGLDADGFLPTGDIGHYTEDGYFYVVDRLKEIIKVKGKASVATHVIFLTWNCSPYVSVV